MPRENVIQVPLNDKQFEFATKQATGADLSMAAWARQQIFPIGRAIVKACEVPSLEFAKRMLARKEFDRDDTWDMLFRIKYQSKESLIAEVTTSDFRNGLFSTHWKQGTRFVLAGGPWLHVLEEDFTSRMAAGEWVTTVRVSVNQAENFYEGADSSAPALLEPGAPGLVEDSGPALLR